MAANLRDILDNTKDIYMTDSAVDTLLDFERVLDELDLYVFANWKKGELVEGPVSEKYFVNCIFMWPYRMMPDPRGAERLLEYGCEVRYKKDSLETPRKVSDPMDYKPGTKYPRSDKLPVWLVEITMPKQLMTDIRQGSLELENETLDMQDVEDAYDQGMDDDVNRTDDAQASVDQEQQQQQGTPA